MKKEVGICTFLLLSIQIAAYEKSCWVEKPGDSISLSSYNYSFYSSKAQYSGASMRERCGVKLTDDEIQSIQDNLRIIDVRTRVTKDLIKKFEGTVTGRVLADFLEYGLSEIVGEALRKIVDSKSNRLRYEQEY